MRVDSRVSKRKFEQEVAKVSAQSKTLSDRWISIQKVAYPFVDVLFIPNVPLRFVQKLSPGTQLPPGVNLPPGTAPDSPFELHQDLPYSTKPFGVRIGLDDFDQRAPSVIFVDPITWLQLPPQMLHQGNHVDQAGALSVVTLPEHPVYLRPFLCMRGIREYHEHPEHTGDDWMQYRTGCGLFSTLDTIWRTCVFNASPVIVFTPHATPPLFLGWGKITIMEK